jgi:hypothetical protein
VLQKWHCQLVQNGLFWRLAARIAYVSAAAVRCPLSGHSRSSSPMADYYQLFLRALTGLGKNPDEAWRAALYARARGALVIELCRITPPLSDAEIDSECFLFEEAIRKVEADLTHRPPSAAGLPTPLPPATQCPQQKFDQGALPMRERESSPEAYKPTRSVRPFGSLEPPSEIPDQSSRLRLL